MNKQNNFDICLKAWRLDEPVPQDVILAAINRHHAFYGKSIPRDPNSKLRKQYNYIIKILRSLVRESSGATHQQRIAIQNTLNNISEQSKPQFPPNTWQQVYDHDTDEWVSVYIGEDGSINEPIIGGLII